MEGFFYFSGIGIFKDGFHTHWGIFNRSGIPILSIGIGNRNTSGLMIPPRGIWCKLWNGTAPEGVYYI